MGDVGFGVLAVLDLGESLGAIRSRDKLDRCQDSVRIQVLSSR